MKVFISSQADWEAESLLMIAGLGSNETSFRDPIESGNYIIALAEKIKAQRSAIAIQPNIHQNADLLK